MSAPELRLLEYDVAWHSVVGRAASGFVASHALLGRIRQQPAQHRGPIRNVREPKVLDMPFERTEAAAEIKKVDLREGNIEAHTVFVNELANEYVSAMARLMYRSMDKISEAAGTTFDAEGRPPSLDVLLDALEQMPLGVDDEGRVKPPMFVVNPETLAQFPPVTDAQQERLADILRRKEAEYAASKRTRRLPR